MKHDMVRIAWMSFVLSLTLLNTSQGKKVFQKTNIIFMTIDDLGYHDVGYNNPEVITPAIDELANGGRKLTQAYVQPSCSPSRASLLSGRYQHKTSIGSALSSVPHCLPTDIKILPEALKERGYATHAVGKWHLGFCQRDCLPTRRGFDTYYGLLPGTSDHYEHGSGNQPNTPLAWFDGETPDDSVKGHHSTDLTTNRTVQIIEESSKQTPFFIWLSWQAPHIPIQAPQKYVDMYAHIEDTNRRDYLAMITHVDDGVEQIMDALRRANQHKRTLIVFMSDNGASGPGNNAPYRGGKACLYEGGIRSPTFVWGSMLRKIKSRPVANGLIHASDWMPTLVGIAGGNPCEYETDGIDQRRMVLKGWNSRRKEIVHSINSGGGTQVAVRRKTKLGDLKMLWGFPGGADGYGLERFDITHLNSSLLLMGLPLDTPPLYWPAVRERHALLAEVIGVNASNIWDFDTGRIQLYNMKDDPEERNDLSDDPVYKHVIRELQTWVAELHTLQSEPLSTLTSQGRTTSVNNTVTTDWCEDLTIHTQHPFSPNSDICQ